MGRGHADGFVEHEPAVNVSLLPLDAGGTRVLAIAINKRASRLIHILETIIHVGGN
jgi:hypothetical protein